MEKIKLTKEQARRFVLSHQGLLPPFSLKGKSGILDHIRRVGCIQFDPLDIVGHNQELVLQSRISGFKPEMLEELLYKDRKLVDEWDKMMSIYPTEDWPYFSRSRKSSLDSLGDSSRPAVSILPQVRKAIEERGPLSSIDLEFDQTVNWAWGPTRIARAALESMYFWGELIVHHKVHTRKVYDFASRHIPEEILSAPDPNETEDQFLDWYVLRRIGGIGLLWGKPGDAWLSIPELNTEKRYKVLACLLSRGDLLEVQVDTIKDPVYMRNTDRPCLEKVLNSGKLKPRAAILAPLDNLLWDRRFIKELFDFDYRWEVYKPVSQRNYGYYVLPVLHGDRFVARFEPGQDKKNKTFIIKNWWWESGVRQSVRLRNDLLDCMKRFLYYLGAENLQINIQAIEKADLDWLASNFRS